MPRSWSRAVVAVLTVALSALVYAACGGSDDTKEADRPAASTSSTTTERVEDFEAEAEDFVNIHDMTPVRGFFIDNRLDHVDEAVAIAEANEGGTYPVGTIIQLVPQEAMVKRHKGWNPASNDWEFFSLTVSKEGTKILTRGGDEVVNSFGMNCADCHAQADAEFDMVCENEHGCDPLPIGRDVLEGLQGADPRPRS